MKQLTPESGPEDVQEEDECHTEKGDSGGRENECEGNQAGEPFEAWVPRHMPDGFRRRADHRGADDEGCAERMGQSCDCYSHPSVEHGNLERLHLHQRSAPSMRA